MLYGVIFQREEVAMQYEAVFSVGGTCTSAHQIRRYFGGSGRTSSCFDWLVTPFNSVSKVLSDDGDRFCLDVTSCKEGGSALCTHYGVLYHHEFARDADHRVIITDDQKASARSKFIYKFNKMISIARERPTLFIRTGSGTDAPGDEAPVTDVELSELLETIAEKLGHREFGFAYVSEEGHHRERAIFNNRDIPNCYFFSDKYVLGELGKDNIWDSIFTSLGFDKNKPPLI